MCEVYNSLPISILYNIGYLQCTGKYEDPKSDSDSCLLSGGESNKPLCSTSSFGASKGSCDRCRMGADGSGGDGAPPGSKPTSDPSTCENAGDGCCFNGRCQSTSTDC